MITTTNLVTDNYTKLVPIIIPYLNFSLKVCFTVFYSLVFIASFVQLCLGVYLRNKMISTQTVYFVICCIFTGLRIILFSFFYKNQNQIINFTDFPFWLLHYFPITVQYVIVLLITVFYYRTYIKTKGEVVSFNRYVYLCFTTPVILIFVLGLLSILVKTNSSCRMDISVLTVRIIITDVIFISTVSFFVHIYKQFPKFPNAKLVQEAKRITRIRCVIVGLICLSVSGLKFSYDITSIVLLYLNRGFILPTGICEAQWMNEKFDSLSLGSFGTVLFLWEVVPLIAAIIIFRVRLPKGRFKSNINTTINSNATSYSTVTNSSSTTKSKFIGVPGYGAINTFGNLSDAASGPLSPGYFGSTHSFVHSFYRQSGQSFEQENAARNSLHSNIQGGSFNNQAETANQSRSYKQNRRSIMKSVNRYIRRSSSSKCLPNSSTIDEGHITKAKSSHLPTADEE